MLACSFGTTPSSLAVLPTGRVNAGGQPVGTIMDNKPMVNVKPFGMCVTLSNPQVAAATSAAQGVLTPQPCIPNTVSPWTPGSVTVKAGSMGVLNSTCTLNCMWGGVITVTMAGQMTTNNS